MKLTKWSLGWGSAGTALTVLAALAGATSARGDVSPGAWRAVGASVDGRPVGDSAGLAGRVSALAVLPGHSPVQLAGTLGGIWRRSPGGSWRDVTSSSWPATAIGSLAVDPVRSNVIYAGTGYDDVDAATAQPGAGILKSTDAGRTWSRLPDSEVRMRGYAVTGLAVYPRDDRIVVAAANNGLFRSVDGGTSWQQVLPLGSLPFGIAEVHLSVDPVTGRMLAGVAQTSNFSARSANATVSTGHGVYVSDDAGRSWNAFAVDSGSGQANSVVPAIATTRGRHPMTYAYALDVTGDRRGGVYISRDGRTWTRMTGQNVVTKFSIGQLMTDPGQPSVAYFAQEDNQLYRYVFGRRTTRKLGSPSASCRFGDFRALAFGPSPLRAPRHHPATHEAIYGGHDGGACFVDLASGRYVDDNAGLVSGLDYSAAAASATEELSGAQDLGMDLYTGGPTTREVFHADGYGVLIDRSSPSRLFAAVNPPPSIGPQHFIASTDRGRSWRQIRLPALPADLFGPTLRLAQAQGDSRLLVLPTPDGKLYVSSDGARSWAARTIPLSGGDRVTAVRAARLPGEPGPVIYAGTRGGSIWRSRDVGLSWQHLPMNFYPLDVRDLVLDPAGSSGPEHEHLVVGLGVYASWAYASYSSAGDVWDSHDSGASWTEIGQALKGTSVNALLLSGSTLLAGTDYGVERYTGGASWASAGDRLPRVRVNDLVLSADGRAFFAATLGRGTWEAPALLARAARR